MAIQAISNGFLGAVSQSVTSLGNLANKVNSLCTQPNFMIVTGAFLAISSVANGYHEYTLQMNEQCGCFDHENPMRWQEIALTGVTGVCGATMVVASLVSKRTNQRLLVQWQQFQAQAQALLPPQRGLHRRRHRSGVWG